MLRDKPPPHFPPGLTNTRFDIEFPGADCFCDELIQERFTQLLPLHNFDDLAADEAVSLERVQGELLCDACQLAVETDRAYWAANEYEPDLDD